MENDWEWDYLPVEGLWKKVTEKEVWEVLKRMKKGKSSGHSEVTCKMFSNDICVRAMWNGKWFVDGREYVRVVEEEHSCSLV